MMREMEHDDELWNSHNSHSLDNLKLKTKDEKEYPWSPGSRVSACVSLN